METVTAPLYCVALKDYPEDLRATDKIKIEIRYAKELERVFGTAENVAAALDTMESLESSPPEEICASDLSLVKEWGRAATLARSAALREVGDAEGCYFDVQRLH